MNSLLGEIIIIVVMIVIEGILWIATGEIPSESASYPKGLLVLAFIISIIYFLMCLYKIKKHGLVKGEKKISKKAMIQIIVFGILVSIYIALLDIIGFLIITPIFIFVTLWYLGMRKKLVLILVPALVTGFTYYLFNYILYVFLPSGLLS